MSGAIQLLPTGSLTPEANRRLTDSLDWMASERPQFGSLLPSHIPFDLFSAAFRAEVIRRPELLECNKVSVMRSLLVSARLGLIPDGVLGQAYLVPFKGEMTVIPGYRGLVTLAMRTGIVKAIWGDVAREGDLFREVRGSRPELIHEPLLDNESEVIAAYACALLSGKVCKFEVLSRKKLESIKARAPSSRSSRSVWNDSDPYRVAEMQIKSAIRKLSKTLPLSTSGGEFHAAIHLQAGAEIGEDYLPEVSQSLAIDLPPESVSVSVPALPDKAQNAGDALATKLGGPVEVARSSRPKAPADALPYPEWKEIGQQRADERCADCDGLLEPGTRVLHRYTKKRSVYEDGEHGKGDEKRHIKCPADPLGPPDEPGDAAEPEPLSLGADPKALEVDSPSEWTTMCDGVGVRAPVAWALWQLAPDSDVDAALVKEVCARALATVGFQPERTPNAGELRALVWAMHEAKARATG